MRTTNHQYTKHALKPLLIAGILAATTFVNPVILQTASAAPIKTTGSLSTSSAGENAATNNLNQYLSRVTSLQANFTQTTQVTNPSRAPASKNLKSTHLNQTFTGVMQVKRPGQFRWETTSPSKQLIITSGTTVWIYDPDLEQVVKQQMDVQVGNTPALLLSGNAASIMKGFKVTQPNPKDAYFVLYPKEADGVFESLGIRFVGTSSNQFAPSQMILKDSLGQQTTINFSNVKLNPSLNNSLFNFVPPKGTDIIEQ